MKEPESEPESELLCTDSIALILTKIMAHTAPIFKKTL
jgi:hypothetical protein